MAKITFDQLLHVYRHIEFGAGGVSGRLTVADHSILETLKLLETDERAYDDAGIRNKGLPGDVVLEAKIEVEVDPPRTGLGLLAPKLDDLLASPTNRVAEPQRYYVVEERFAYNDVFVPDAIARYRSVLKFVKALSEAAALVDEHKAEAIFLSPGKIRVPLLFDASDLAKVSPSAVDELETFVLDKMHKDQKAAILAANIIELCSGQPELTRFRFLLEHLSDLVAKARDGYRLFASEFSYEKIRGKTEEAISDYTNKIHKTFHDIQNQVMGIPVATVIVATQLKSAPDCGVVFWANLAISIGATLFVLLMSAAIYNQFLTLEHIEGDLARQRAKLEKDYATVADDFTDLYSKLESRIANHRKLLWTIIISCWAGGIFTWVIFYHLTTQPLRTCIIG